MDKKQDFEHKRQAGVAFFEIRNDKMNVMEDNRK